MPSKTLRGDSNGCWRKRAPFLKGSWGFFNVNDKMCFNKGLHIIYKGEVVVQNVGGMSNILISTREGQTTLDGQNL